MFHGFFRLMSLITRISADHTLESETTVIRTPNVCRLSYDQGNVSKQNVSFSFASEL
jgi:hypothetical protein